MYFKKYIFIIKYLIHIKIYEVYRITKHIMYPSLNAFFFFTQCILKHLIVIFNPLCPDFPVCPQWDYKQLEEHWTKLLWP